MEAESSVTVLQLPTPQTSSSTVSWGGNKAAVRLAQVRSKEAVH
jgi:hypothetical protein